MLNAINNLTKARLEKQIMVPLSPGRHDRNGNPLLCLGAALVESHLRLTQGVRAATDFSRYIVQQRSSTAIVAVAKASGFPASLCRRAVLLNDSYAELIRKEAVLNLLDQSLDNFC